jgi:hypothetical protein
MSSAHPREARRQEMTGLDPRSDLGPLPVACSLTSADVTVQAARWQRLATRALIGRKEVPDGLRMFFLLEAGVSDELRSLVAVERECCRWASWTVQETAGQAVLDIRSSGEGIAALHGMFLAL